ncbi:MAG TPA: Uma2 family endonuclease [Tepidisphaeraceae bacterium]|jgi:Uma2 family endonuclease|nr:Uma2 family endonuclease [Tepidisphaeraceae bacterium]
MTRLASKPPQPTISLDEAQHFVLDNVSWDFYERLLKEIGNRPIRVTFDNGMLEIMAPLSEHEIPRGFLGWMIKTLALLTNRPMISGGSTTFRRREKQKGLEPDDCFFFESSPKMQRVKRWNPKVHPPPDLAVEIDIFSRSIDREPIYVALGVRELWRYDGQNLRCFHLINDQYALRKYSKTFPFLEVALLQQFLDHLDEVPDETKVIREFIAWVKKNGWASESE